MMPRREGATAGGAAGFLLDLEVPVTVRFARTRMLLGEVAAIGSRSVIPLDRLPDDPVELLVNGALVARGHVVSADGNCAIRISELVRLGGARDRVDPWSKE
jgi:flagellar motor switch protein FliN